jgi:hypothetical protein
VIVVPRNSASTSHGSAEPSASLSSEVKRETMRSRSIGPLMRTVAARGGIAPSVIERALRIAPINSMRAFREGRSSRSLAVSA